MDNNVILYIIIAALVIIFIVQMVINYRTAQSQLAQNHQTTVNLVDVFQKTITDLQNSPVFLENAKAAGRSVPQEVFDTVYNRLDALEQLVGKTTIIGKALGSGEAFLKEIDSNPDNDPVVTTTQTTAGSVG